MRTNRTLERGRRRAEALMTDTWKCERVTPGTFDSSTGQWSESTTEAVYDGPGGLRDNDGQGKREESQGETTMIGALRLSLPVATSGALRIDDILECTAAAHDAALVGVRVRVSDLHLDARATARRLSVEVDSWPTT